jgi:hypothetical protein
MSFSYKFTDEKEAVHLRNHPEPHISGGGGDGSSIVSMVNNNDYILLDHQESAEGETAEGGGKDKVEDGNVTRSIVFGVINSIAVLPVMFAYATIIFSDKFFQSEISTLTKLVLFSSTVSVH